MNCAAARERMVALQDGELSPGMAVRVGEHLASCSACRELEVCLRASTPIAGPGLPMALRQSAWQKIDRAIGEAWSQPAPVELPMTWSDRLAERVPLPAVAVAGYAAALVFALTWGASNWMTARHLEAELQATRTPVVRITDVPADQYRAAAWTPPVDETTNP